jgi:predicted DNA-binding transcriptional regulator AlpA
LEQKVAKRQPKFDPALDKIFAEKRVISEDEAARILGVSPDTLRRNAERGNKPERLRLSARRVGYRLSEVLSKTATA